jgi:hypothetical protein
MVHWQSPFSKTLVKTKSHLNTNSSKFCLMHKLNELRERFTPELHDYGHFIWKKEKEK